MLERNSSLLFSLFNTQYISYRHYNDTHIRTTNHQSLEPSDTCPTMIPPGHTHQTTDNNNSFDVKLMATACSPKVASTSIQPESWSCGRQDKTISWVLGKQLSKCSQKEVLKVRTIWDIEVHGPSGIPPSGAMFSKKKRSWR